VADLLIAGVRKPAHNRTFTDEELVTARGIVDC